MVKCVQKGLAVPIIPKDCFSLIPPAGDMVNSAGIFYAQGTGHVRNLLQQNRHVKKIDLTPILVMSLTILALIARGL